MKQELKINQLIQNLPKGLVLLSSWMATEGYPYELQQLSCSQGIDLSN